MIPQATHSGIQTGASCKPCPNRAFFHARQAAGFSLVEIMVGMVMGLLGMIVILQMMTLFEGQKRTTTGGDDAQNSAAISMHTLQQDIEQAGLGFSNMGLLNCNYALGVLAPVTINPAAAIIPLGDPNTDRLLIAYGNSNSIAEGNPITAQSGVSGNLYSVQLPSSFRLNDRVIAAGIPCGNLLIDRVSVAPIVGDQAVTVVSGVAVTIPGSLYNLGQSPQFLAYAIRRGNLTVCDYSLNNCGNAALTNNPSVWMPIAKDIVSLRAEYGRDDLPTPGATPVLNQAQINTIVNATVPPSPIPNYIVNKFDQNTPTTACGWARTSAIRLVLVARGQYEKEDTITTVAKGNVPQWDGTATTPINLTADVDWQHYRYKTLETLVPIRNITWMGVQAGC